MKNQDESGHNEWVMTGLRLLVGFVIFSVTMMLMSTAGNPGIVIAMAGLSYCIGRGIFPPHEPKEEYED